MSTSPEDDSVKELVSANERFYRAFEDLDIEEMGRVWSHKDGIICVHPGWDLITGWDAVEESWRRIFESTEYMKFEITNLKVTARADMGVLVGLENVVSVVAGEQTGRFGVVSTNIFERTKDGVWLLIHHHGSPVANYVLPPPSRTDL